jgi:hypothetical protein
MTPSKKYYRFGMWLCLILTLAFFVLIFAALFSEDTMRVGIIIAATLDAVGCVSAALFCRNQARKFSKVSSEIAEGKNVLAHWTYFDSEWIAFTELDYQIDKKRYYKISWLATAYCILATVILMLVYPKDTDSSNYYFLISVFLIMGIMMWPITFITLRRNYRHNKQIKGDTIITSDALKFNGKLYAWNTANQELISVKYMQGPPPMLAFEYGKGLRRGQSRFEARVPIPNGKEEKARDIVRFFQDALGQSVMIQNRKR